MAVDEESDPGREMERLLALWRAAIKRRQQLSTGTAEWSAADADVEVRRQEVIGFAKRLQRDAGA